MPKRQQGSKSDSMAESSYRLSQLPTTQNKRYFPQGGKRHHPFGKGLLQASFCLGAGIGHQGCA